MRTGTPGHLRTFDYIGFQRYFLTFCTNRREPIFVSHESVDLVRTQFLRAADDEQFVIVIDCFMPDHVHLLAEGTTERSDGRRFISRAKQFSGFYYQKRFGRALWQRYGYERALRTEDDTLGVARYILENPVRAGLVRSPQDYQFSYSPRYAVQDVLEALTWARPRSA
ncbi:MAG TPA: transposase [Vicinamibacterales bacterium]